MKHAAAPVLSPQHAAFLQSGVSIIAASRNAANIPSVVRCLGCRVGADDGTVLLLLAASQGEALLTDIRACGAIAVVFSNPASHQTLQLKASDAAVVTVTAEDMTVVEAYRQRMLVELDRVGFGETFARAFFESRPEDLVGIRFTPEAAFDQTPGPRAGAKLEGGA